MSNETFQTPSAVGLKRGDKGADVEILQGFLQRYGYLAKPEAGGSALPRATAGLFDDPTVIGLRNYQVFFRLPVTGLLDAATVSHMKLPRCGVPEPRVRPAEPAFGFVPFGAGRKWQKTQLTYNFESFGTLDPAAVRTDIQAAFALWSEHTPLSFTEVAGLSDIKISFGQLADPSHLAVAFGPPNVAPQLGSMEGDITFDIARRWSTADPCPDGFFEFRVAAAHEIGHSLGLDHSQVPGVLMDPFLQRGHRFLSEDDIAGAQHLYGPRLVQSGSQLQLGGITSDGRLWQTTRFPTTWAPFIDVEAKAGDAGTLSDVDVQIMQTDLHLCGVSSSGILIHSIRRADGSWTFFTDLGSQIGNPGPFARVAVTQFNGDVQVVAVTPAGELVHAARRANGAWELQPVIKQQAGNPGVVIAADAASLDGEMHIFAITADGRLWRTSRGLVGAWRPFEDVEASAGERGSFVDVACIGFNHELQICGVTSDGKLWHTIRVPAGARAQFGDVEVPAGDRGSFTRVTVAAIGDELHLAGTTSDGRLWHAARMANGEWTPLGDVEAFAGDRGGFIAAGVSGTIAP